MSVAILISVTFWNSLAPFGSTIEVDVVDVRAGVNNVGVDALTRICRVEVLSEWHVSYDHTVLKGRASVLPC